MQNPYALDTGINDDGQPDEFVEDPKTAEDVILVFLVNNSDRRDARVTIVFN